MFRRGLLPDIILFTILICLSPAAQPQPISIRVEGLSPSLWHLEMTTESRGHGPIATSTFIAPFIAPAARFSSTRSPKASYILRHKLSSEGVQCLALSSIVPLFELCPTLSGDKITGMRIRSQATQNIYGLGEQFRNPGQVNGDWSGSVRTPAIPQGNAMEAFEGAAAGNAQFPILYALTNSKENFAIFIDQSEPLTWNFKTPQWQISTAPRATMRFYIIAGSNLADLRHAYMDLVGHPLVPPKKAFGLWVSEFGYHNWQEMDNKLQTLRARHFPLDGFVLDAFWYGTFMPFNEKNHFGNMAWDEKNFPRPAEKIRDLQVNHGLELMLAENPFINTYLDSFRLMSPQYLVHKAAGDDPLVIDNYLGKIAVIDWSNSQGADLWHDRKRQPLIESGVRFHWTDFAEVDGYGGNDWYTGGDHSAMQNHNLYAFDWAKSIARGYARNNVKRRHFIMSRSGAPGIQRFGASMWSGDIASNMEALAAQMNVQMHLSLSGIDYFGSDIGGYRRQALRGDMNEVYTRWFAHSAAFDVPVRPHTDNGLRTQFTAPDRVGNRKSNLANIRLRYELSPYYYSLAHRAFRYGDPLVAPLVYYYPLDPAVRTLADEKMVGPSILMATAAHLGESSRSVYLPKGTWLNFYSRKWIHSLGQEVQAEEFSHGLFHLPLFVRAGAIIPILWVDDQTMNILGRRMDGTVITDLNLRIFPSERATGFNIYEDDGDSTEYLDGKVAVTHVSQKMSSDELSIEVGATQGNYEGAPQKRRVVLHLMTERKIVTGSLPARVYLNGRLLPLFTERQKFEKAGTGVYIVSPDQAIIRSDAMDIRRDKSFLIKIFE